MFFFFRGLPGTTILITPTPYSITCLQSHDTENILKTRIYSIMLNMLEIDSNKSPLVVKDVDTGKQHFSLRVEVSK